MFKSVLNVGRLASRLLCVSVLRKKMLSLLKACAWVESGLSQSSYLPLHLPFLFALQAAFTECIRFSHSVTTGILNFVSFSPWHLTSVPPYRFYLLRRCWRRFTFYLVTTPIYALNATIKKTRWRPGTALAMSWMLTKACAMSKKTCTTHGRNWTIWQRFTQTSTQLFWKRVLYQFSVDRIWFPSLARYFFVFRKSEAFFHRF